MSEMRMNKLDRTSTYGDKSRSTSSKAGVFTLSANGGDSLCARAAPVILGRYCEAVPRAGRAFYGPRGNHFSLAGSGAEDRV